MQAFMYWCEDNLQVLFNFKELNYSYSVPLLAGTCAGYASLRKLAVMGSFWWGTRWSYHQPNGPFK